MCEQRESFFVKLQKELEEIFPDENIHVEDNKVFLDNQFVGVSWEESSLKLEELSFEANEAVKECLIESVVQMTKDSILEKRRNNDG